ncbi:MAG: ATP-binding protein [Opitutales bacterium]
MNDLIERSLYMDRVRPFIGRDLIKVFVGQRRVGKSCLLGLLERELRKSDNFPNIIRIDLELPEFSGLQTDGDLLAYVGEHKKNGRNALLIDEVQEITNFERALRGLNASGEFDIYCTGSNASLLSRELSTLLAGRCIEIPVYTLTYPEYLVFHRRDDSDEALKNYLRFGGLPYLRHLDPEGEVLADYLRNIYQAILYRDVVSRHNLRNTLLLEQVVHFLADAVGSPVTARRISDFLKSQHLKTSPKVILDYLGHLRKACFVDKVPRYDIRGRRLFEVNDKFYFGDLGLRNAVVGYRPGDIGQLLENTVYHHLRARGHQVRVGSLGDREIDFIAEKNGALRYYQVAYLLPDQKTVDREFGNLAKIPDDYPKFVISMDPMAGDERGGIRHLPLREFLLHGNEE